MPRMQPALIILVAVSVTLLIGGVALTALGLQTRFLAGWSGQQPPSGTWILPTSVMLVPFSAISGAAVSVLGLVGLAVAGGYAIGREHARRD